MAKTFNYGNGIWATKTGSSMAYNDQNDNYKPLPFSVTRDSIATRVNKQGLIEVVGQDKLRIDYTDSTKGVALLEPARTNLITYSEDFSQWLLDGSQSSPTTITDTNPDGSSQVYQIELNTGGNIYRTISVSSSTDYTFSVYIKGSGFGRLILSNPQSVPENYVDFTATSEWQRIELTGSSSSTSIRVAIGSWSNSPANGNIQIYGAQLEQGSYSTSYIPTSGLATQRQSDVANGAGNSEVFNDSEGVLFADIAKDKGSQYSLISLQKTGDTNTYAYIGFLNNTTQIKTEVKVAGTSAFNKTRTFSDTSQYFKIALKYKSGDYALWINGFQTDTGTSTTIFSDGDLKELELGNHNNSIFRYYGKSKQLGVYDAVLTDAELEALTSYTSFTNMANELNLTIK